MVDLVAAYMLSGTIALFPSLYFGGNPTEAHMGRGLLLWLIGIPLPIILLIWLFGGLH
jgi:hypothetical protein